MKMKSHASLVLVSGLILSLLLSPSLIAQEQEQTTKAQTSKIVIIPDQVKKVFDEGMPTRQVRPDIPFSVTEHLYFPAGQNLYTIILFKVKNADLGFAPTGPEKKKEEALTAFETEASKLQARSHLFLQFNKLENNVPGEILQEVYIPLNLQEDSSTYEPEKEDFYSAGYLLTPGNYLLSMAVCSQKLEKIGTQYYEFSLPEIAALTDTLITTPIFLVKAQKYLESPERRPTAHKGSFVYSIVNIEPNVEKVFSSEDNLGLFFYIFGAQQDEAGKFSIEVAFDIMKGEEKAILFSPQKYDAPLINQELPLVRTVLIKSEEGDKTEKREVEAGTYTLKMTITDNVSGKSIIKSIDFDVR